MNQCRNQNRPNTLLLNVFWKHDTFLARIRKVIKLKERSQVSNPTWVMVLPLPPRNRNVSRNRKSANPRVMDVGSIKFLGSVGDIYSPCPKPG